jgi:PhnB protein
MPATDAYLFFNGNCAEAMRAYEKILGGKLEIIPLAGTPSAKDLPNAKPDATMHARLEFEGGAVMASDWLDTAPYPGMAGFAVSLVYKNVADAKRIFDAFAQGGKVPMPAGETFWAEFFGMAVDRFGTPWMVSGASKPM